MNATQIKKTLIEILTTEGIEPKIELSEAKIEAEMLIKHFANFTDMDFALNKELDSAELINLLIEKAHLRANTRQPIQHIIGLAHFMGEDFIVNEHVLIPRDETEFLVRKAVELIKKNDFKMVLDIGTGSGCIACMIAKLTQVQVVGVDISIEALQVAIDNASKLGLFNKAIFRKSDVFSNVKGGEKFDLIVSNPPYIPLSEKGNLQKEVGFDPASALFATDEFGIEFYEKISKQAPMVLNKGGYLIFELGINQAPVVAELMKQSGFGEIETLQDLAGIERVIWGRI